MPNSDIMMTSIFMALSGTTAYSTFLPTVLSVNDFVDTQEKVAIVRKGELIGTVFLLGLTGVTAAILKSIVPFLFGLVAAGLTLTVYELALKDATGGQMVTY
jgi:hypothetical protein